MNWTGGRLRRHSEINTKSRKQAFRKSTTSDRKCPSQITLFTKYRENGEQESGPFEGTNTKSADEQAGLIVPTQQSSSNDSLATDTRTSLKSQDKLAHLKRQLLETADWGAVAAARPLSISFTSTADMERFGKRRRLTTDDRERLRLSSISHPEPRREIPYEGEIPSDMEIRINGMHPRRRDRGIDEGSLPKDKSSQSMLLDHEELSCSNVNPDVRAQRVSENSAERVASELSMLSNDSKLQLISYDCESADAISDARRNAPITPWFSQDVRLESLQSNGSSLIIPQPESPVRRRFTIDDQMIADREGRFTLSSPATQRPTQQLVHTRGSGSYLPSSPQTAGNIYSMDRFNDIATHSQSIPTPDVGSGVKSYYDLQESSQIFESSAFIPPTLDEPLGFSSLEKEKEQQMSPVKIFGQPFSLEDSVLGSSSLARRKWPSSPKGLEPKLPFYPNFPSEK